MHKMNIHVKHLVLQVHQNTYYGNSLCCSSIPPLALWPSPYTWWNFAYTTVFLHMHIISSVPNRSSNYSASSGDDYTPFEKTDSNSRVCNNSDFDQNNKETTSYPKEWELTHTHVHTSKQDLTNCIWHSCWVGMMKTLRTMKVFSLWGGRCAGVPGSCAGVSWPWTGVTFSCHDLVVGFLVHPRLIVTDIFQCHAWWKRFVPQTYHVRSWA